MRTGGKGIRIAHGLFADDFESIFRKIKDFLKAHEGIRMREPQLEQFELCSRV